MKVFNETGVGIGDRVYRALDVTADCEGNPVYRLLGSNNFEKTERSSVVRIFSSELLCQKLRLVTFDEARSGVIGFCDRPIPEDWLYFVVIGISARSKCVYVTPVVGNPERVIKMEREAFEQRRE